VDVSGFKKEGGLRKKVVYPIGFFIGLFLVLYFFSPAILNGAGEFLAPTHNGKEEIVILEGTATINNKAVKEGVDLVGNDRKRLLVVVVHLHKKEGQLFAIQEEYPQLLRNKLKTLGLKEKQLKIIFVPINDHPITLTEARFVMPIMAKEGIRNAVLVSEGFHTRRSWAVYRQEGERFKISVKPHPYFINYEKENWWHQKEGIRDFVQEFSKLAYYLSFRYISLKSIFTP
jgi:hypothetical protein